VKDGELVCEGQYVEELLQANKWYYPIEIKTVVRLQQVLAVDIKMDPKSQRRTIYYHGVDGHSEKPHLISLEMSRYGWQSFNVQNNQPRYASPSTPRLCRRCGDVSSWTTMKKRKQKMKKQMM
jgi:hypothetical protein